jgi:hypothetical protein
MRLAFICGSLETGKDGVGDYCRRLGGEMQKLGHDVLLLSLNDPWHRQQGGQSGQRPAILRLGSADSLKRRSVAAQEAIRSFEPDWVSLQYVCYAYHPKGLAWQWNSLLAKVADLGKRRHIMFHELWIEPPPLRRRFIGWAQRLVIRDLYRRLRPDAVSTSMTLYQRRLLGAGIEAGVLPLFGNIPVAERDDDHVAKLLRDAGSRLVQTPRADFMNGVFFGTVHPDFDVTPLVKWLAELKGQTSRPILLSLLGRNGPASERVAREIKKLSPPANEVIAIGEHPAETISQALQYADFGINTGSPETLGKSGTFAAMREHGLPVVLSDGKLDSVFLSEAAASARPLSTNGSVAIMTKYQRSPISKTEIASRVADLFRL